ncbi:efflux transporter outer membrane subunit [Paraburkholderia silvatlantica]|uniref:NodT family efflux transporter outer membrane factor (OMF) lipoprotein n=1 Tax=Paraburkholderia silvatlantica TaxID=321895 RepID=A0A2U1A7Q2_9BURK|nr:efflux transporter outer membrane subunit [Paraburkholderia silvatlantica]MBB2931216.1 NodT family efflux transporter outer membrane factor (OMF) lipoprotein [Paraburkholderia silvatlantica]PVY28624.1 NodT family efflux transporter outer membrane factor (OMF) lipoprotein [Paraburkholderia silvatlantica]PXW36261.1 NodT family efflux transporter outer membrane factor (OMF) lipoprotein [Paraburkholderia silvatlantica]PYE21584.1 NodT family efflux transporter outer membrane factor (OMF) lipoprot
MQSPVPRGLAALTVLAFSLIIAGCASTGGIAPQAQHVQASELDAGSAIRAANSDAQWPASDWWRSYNDAQLNAWIEASIADNPTLAAAQARVREARSMVGVARAGLLPQVNGSMSVQRQHWSDNIYYGPGALGDSNSWNNTATLGLSYHLDLWGQDRNNAERALDMAHATAADERAAQLELEINVTRAYIDLSMNYALLDIAKQTLAQQEKLLSLAKGRFAGGLGTQLEVSEAETPLPEYERQIDAVEEDIALGKNRLAALAGKGPGAGESIERPALSLAAPAGLPSALPAELIGHRPDVVAARWTVAAQARGIDVARADFYPNVNLLVSMGGYAAAGPLFQFLKSMSGSYTGGPAVSLPIFDGGRLRGQLGAQSAIYDVAVEQYNQTIVTALREIADQVVRMRSLATQEEDSHRSVANAQRTFDLATESYRRGLRDYVNVVIAQKDLLAAQQGLVRIQAGRLSAHAALVGALGGGAIDSSSNPVQAELLPAHGKKKRDLPPMPAAWLAPPLPDGGAQPTAPVEHPTSHGD